MALLSVGCSKDQDPLKGEDKSIREGTPRGQEKPTSPPVSTQEILVEMEPVLAQFEEGEESTLKFSVRILDPEIKKAGYDIKINNLDKFPGATFDENTGEFTWTPATDFVEGDRLIQPQNVEITVTTKSVPTLDRTQYFGANVYRAADRPEITSITGVENIYEGTNLELFADVTDLDSDGLNPPTLQVVAINGRYRDASSLVIVRSAELMDSNDPTKWRFKLWLETSGKELTNSKESFRFGLVAVSQFGVTSIVSSNGLFIYTKVPAPLTTLERRLTMNAGDTRTFSFAVYSPYSQTNRGGRVDSEGQVRMKLNRECVKNFRGRQRCNCMESSASKLLCTVTLKADYHPQKEIYDFKYTAENINRYSRDDVKRLSFSHRLIVNGREKPKPNKPIPPNPNPNP